LISYLLTFVTTPTAEEMDQADSELRDTITHIWPLQAKKMIDLLVPRSEEINAGKLSVGKIYGGLLILESWRNTKFGQLETDAPVSNSIHIVRSVSLPELTPRNEFYLVSFRHLFLFLSKINFCDLQSVLCRTKPTQIPKERKLLP
jgi:Voltage gated calcium channel IQ domain